MAIEVGTKLTGYCNGYFGRDSYGEKRVLHVGPDYVVVEELQYVGEHNTKRLDGLANVIMVAQHDDIHEILDVEENYA